MHSILPQELYSSMQSMADADEALAESLRAETKAVQVWDHCIAQATHRLVSISLAVNMICAVLPK